MSSVRGRVQRHRNLKRWPGSNALRGLPVGLRAVITTAGHGGNRHQLPQARVIQVMASLGFCEGRKPEISIPKNPENFQSLLGGIA